jgi:lysophospholipase L1-like esterase
MDKKSKGTLLRGLLIRFRQTLKSPVSGILWVLSIFIIVPALLAFTWGGSIANMAILFAVLVVTLLLSVEILFRLGYRFMKGQIYHSFPRLNFNKIYVKPHPYIPFVMKRNFKTETAGPANYPLHKGRFSFGQYNTNNIGFVNGVKGDRDVATPKPEGLYRINCIGASTTGNYIVDNGHVFSFPLELEKLLKSTMATPVEVNNCGQGGYNSADIMVRFALQVIDTQPDIVVIYHAYNDIRAYLTAGFESDYSHVRCNLGENYWKFALAARIPYIPLKFLNFSVNQWLPANIRNSLLDQVTIGNFDTRLDLSIGLSTYQRNLQHIIDICQSNGIQVILSTYCHFLHDAIKEEPLHLLYADAVNEENKIMRRLAHKNGIKLVDNAVLVPDEERYFVDSVHFTPDGMQLVAKNIANVIIGKDLLDANVRSPNTPLLDD